MVLKSVPRKQPDADTVPELFFSQVKRYSDRDIVYYREKGSFVAISWQQMGSIVESVAAYLIKSGVKKGDRVAVFSGNCWQWWAADLAALSVGAVTVPIYSTNSADDAQYILRHSTTSVCFVGDTDQLSRVMSVRRAVPSLKKIISFHDSRKKGIVPLDEAVVIGGKIKNGTGQVARRAASVKADDLMSIVYTSGTTGNPKGVMLSHKNILSDVRQMLEVYGPYLGEDDLFLSFLPLSHVLERVGGYYTPLMLGSRVAFAENFRTIQADMKEMQPTVIVAVPRLFEKIHAGVKMSVSAFSPIKKFIFSRALAVGKKNIPNVCANRDSSGLLTSALGFFDKNVFSVLRSEIGFNRVRAAISGGGPLSFNDLEFFLSIGVNVFEGFGLTEAAPVTNVNYPGKMKPGTVGLAMKQTKVIISDQGEILVKGPQVMSGYYRDKNETKDVFDKKGFLKTGDIGSIDDEGFLSITGRIKDIIVTAGGKNISPQNIELALKNSRFIEQVALIGDRRKYLSALVIPAFDQLEKWAVQSGLEYKDKRELVEMDEVRELYEREIYNVIKDFARVEQIKRFRVLDTVWGIDTGELTPSLKVKRRVIEEKYAEIIDSMYRD
jgi:long-chain acyl-CoA synthetase